MGNHVTRASRLSRAVLFVTAAISLTGTFALVYLAPRASADNTGNYAIQVKLSNPRTDVKVTATRQKKDGLPDTTVTLTGSGTDYKSGTIRSTNSETCNLDHAYCSWAISVKDSSNNEIGDAAQTYTYVRNKTGVDKYGAPTLSVHVPAAGSSPSSTGSVTGKARFVDYRANNTLKNVPPSVTITFTQTAGGNSHYTTSTSCGGTYTIHTMTPGTYSANIHGGYQNPNDMTDAVSIDFTQKNITVTGGKTTTADIQVPSPDSSAPTGTSNDTPGCDAPASTDPSSSSSSTKDDTLNCGAGRWNWFFCFGIQVMQGAAQQIDNFIMSQLNVNTGKIFDSSNTPVYKTAWNSFRVIATAILIIGGLIMVASQALGFEILDAYTIRKVLPRILIAAIGISLSWPLLLFVIDFFNTVGFDIRNLIYAPFDQIAKQGSNTGLILLGNPLTLIAAGSALFVAYGPAIFTFLLTALLALLLALLVLVVRQIAIVVLVILAPVAIACYILPNTQKVWKLWMDNFLGLMLMFPIISALIAAGHVVSAVGRGPAASLMEQFIAFIAYFIPYFMLPFAFRMATGAISTIAGLVNDRGKGAFDRLKKYRGAKAAENMHKLREGSRFSERNAFTRGFNRVSGDMGSGWKGGFGFGARGTQARDQRERAAAMNEVMKSHGWATIQENDDALRAATYDSASIARQALYNRAIASGKTEAEAAQTADNAVAAVQASIGFGRAQAIASAQQLATTGTGYTDLADQAMTIARASGGNQSTLAAISGYNNFISKQKGRHDLAPGAGNLIGISTEAMKGSGPAAAAAAKNIENAWNSGSLYQLANGKGVATKNFAEHWTKEYEEALSMTPGKARDDRLKKVLMARNEMQAMMPNSTGDNQVILNNTLAAFDEMEQQYTQAQGFTGSTMGPITADAAAREAAYQRLQREARSAARTYERPDPNRLGTD